PAGARPGRGRPGLAPGPGGPPRRPGHGAGGRVVPRGPGLPAPGRRAGHRRGRPAHRPRLAGGARPLAGLGRRGARARGRGARLARAELHAASGDRATAATTLATARAILTPLDARPALARAEALEAWLLAPPAAPAALPFGLTAREAEVLRLLAEGLPDAQIA